MFEAVDRSLSGRGVTQSDDGSDAAASLVDCNGMSESEHFVQFYEADGFLLDSLGGYVCTGLGADETVVVVATEAHREGLDERLRARGLDVAAENTSGRYVSLDAAVTLSSFMVDGSPEPGRFADVVGGIIARAAGGRRVRIFGEMVALLWADGSYDAAIRLEELWNGLRETHSFRLFCAYPMNGIGGEMLAGPFGGVCTAHSRVVPGESYTTLADPEDRLRAILQLQQKARSLEAVKAELEVQVVENTRLRQRVRQDSEERRQLLTLEREARAEAEAANRVRDEFLATVSHELRTPLTAIVGWTDMLRSGQLDEQSAANALATVERNAHAQTQIVGDLLDVSRIIAGKLRLNVQPVNPATYIEAGIEAVRPAAEAKGVRILKVIDTGAGVVAGDPARLQQVAWNLLSNAVKFTPRGGRVQVRLGRVDPHVEVEVSDTGDGIKPEFLPYVFDRFRQADMSSTRRHGGLGLGLAIVRHLVELHGGTVSAESRGEGLGSTFTIALPLSS